MRPVAEPTYLATGTVLQDRYEIAGELGRGGCSVVYRARDRRVGSDVAIKLLVPPPAAARLARERLRREVQAVRQLSLPNIVTVYDVADDGPWSFVVMEHVPGPDLAVRVRDRGPLDPDAAARLGRDVAAALHAAHRRGILHRDVKPQNILLDPDGRARLTDFGSARLAGMATVTQTGGLVGTLAYAAPEVVAGARGDARADCYGLGLTLYFALLGELPARATLRTGPVPEPDGYHPRGRRADIPVWLEDAVARATASDPELLVSAPVVAAGLASVAALGRRTPVWNPPPTGRSALPAQAERDAVRTLTALPTGAARRLLIDLLRRVSAMPQSADLIGPLVVAACAAARELAALEQHLDAFDTERERLADPPAGWLDALARWERGRDAMVQRLLDATATLSRVSADVALRAASPRASLADLTRELDAESRLQAGAAREVEALLGKTDV